MRKLRLPQLLRLSVFPLSLAPFIISEKGIRGIIQGSQCSDSFIVAEKGNADSFNSCSHGAGCKMSRHQAVKILDLRSEAAGMEAAGILHSLKTRADLLGFKDMESVMTAQNDLVEIKIRLKPVASVKG